MAAYMIPNNIMPKIPKDNIPENKFEPNNPPLSVIKPGPKKKTNPTIRPSIRCFIFTLTTTRYLL